MNNLIKILSQNGELVVNSRQIANDFEREHSSVVVRSIENLIKELEGSGQSCTHLFIESEYENEQNKQIYKEYLLTRDGFSLLVMGFTGAKALKWKLKYIKAFNEMEQSLKSVQPKLSKELQAIFTLDEKQQIIEGRVELLENTMTIDYSQQQELSLAAKFKIVKTLGGKDAPAYKRLNKQAFCQFWKDYQRFMHVNSYRNTAVKELGKGYGFVSTWKPTEDLSLMILGANSQMRM